MSNPIQSRNESTGQRGASGDECLHCPECGYDLRGQTVQRCPECGFHYDRPGLEYLEEEALQRCLGPLVDAINVLLTGILLSIFRGAVLIGDDLLHIVRVGRRGTVLPLMILAIVGLSLLLVIRDLLLDWIQSKPWHICETARDTYGALLTAPRLLVLCAVAGAAQFVLISKVFFLAISACLFVLGFGWTVLGINRIKDIPVSEGQPAMQPSRACMLARARQAVLACLILHLIACGIISGLL